MPAAQLIPTDIAKIIFYMYSTQQQNEREAIMEKLSELEANPVQQIQNVMAAITDEAAVNFPDELLSSNAVYLKNFGNTVIKNSVSQIKTADCNPSEIISRLLGTIKIFVQGMLSANFQMKHKHHLCAILNRLFFQMQQLDKSPQ